MFFSFFLYLPYFLTNAQEKVAVHDFRVVNTYPHSKQDFTQGFLVKGNSIYQSTGLYGRSELQHLHLTNNTKIKSKALNKKHFGEGLTEWNNKLFQLTWKENVMMVYDINTFDLIETVKYPAALKEGWGICSDGTYLYISDGSHKIYVMNPADYSIIKTILVTSLGQRITRINELEWVDGEIWANIWYAHYIIRIDPSTGKINSWVNLTGLEQDGEYSSWNAGEVLNGIAYDNGKIYVTGKNWAHIYEIELGKITVLEQIPINSRKDLK